MKLMINYDFFNKIRNVREPLSPLKIIRNEKKGYIVRYSLLTIIIWAPAKDITITSILPVLFGIQISLEFLFLKLLGDIYVDEAKDDLKMLIPQLRDLQINTNYELLLKSELYQTKYKIKFNEKKLPYILQSKYVMIPTYNYNGDEAETSILQEHVVGTKEYVLSLGSPKKQLKLAYSTT